MLRNSNSQQNMRSSFGSFTSNNTANTALPERLLHEADRRKENREKLKRERDLLMMEECSFQPNLISRNNGTPFVNKNKLQQQGPIHLRVEEL